MSFEETKEEVQDYDSSFEPCLANKRKQKAHAKCSKRVAIKTNEAAGTSFNSKIIEDAVANFQRKDPEKPRRGRKPIREDIYIETSLNKIAEMEKKLKEENLTSKEHESLRNKASALRSRVNRKLEQKSMVQDMHFAKTQFAKLS